MNNIKLPIAKHIKAEREERGWSIEQLAEKSRIHPMTLQKIELGYTQNPNLSTLYYIARAFGTTVGNLEVGKCEQVQSKSNYPFSIIGNQLKQLREEANITGTEMGRCIGKTKQHVYRYERGIGDMRYLDVKGMLENTWFTIDDLLSPLYNYYTPSKYSCA